MRCSGKYLLSLVALLVAGCGASYSLDVQNETGAPLELTTSMPTASIDVAPGASGRIEVPNGPRGNNGIYLARSKGDRLYVRVENGDHLRLVARLQDGVLILVPLGTP